MNSIVTWGGTALMLLLLWRMIAWRAWRFYPVFFWFFVFLVLRWLPLWYLSFLWPREDPTYSLLFWLSSLLVDLLRLLVAWEIFRTLLAPGTKAHRVAGILLAAALLGLAAFSLSGGVQTGMVIVNAKITLSLVAAVGVFTTLAVGQHYGVRPSVNAWGIALGTGIFSSFTVVNFASLGIDVGVFRVFGYANALSFEATLLIWLWTLWSFRPQLVPPAIASASAPAQAIPYRAGALRKILGLDGS